MLHSDFTHARNSHHSQFKYRSHLVRPLSWQSSDVSAKPEALIREITQTTFSVPLQGIEDLGHWRGDIQPNTPWADQHFTRDRVSGHPLNPGHTWTDWPYANKADSFRDERGQFSHTYAERYWPRFAGQSPSGRAGTRQLTGIRFDYGDLDDLVTLLLRDPLTRQAYLPVWFPEDTGVTHKERVPCSLGYWFLQRGGYFHIYYPIRSCDFIRHYADDVYLTVRLLLWVLEQLRELDSHWKDTKLGMFTMWIGSFHMFINDWNKLYAQAK